MNTTASAIISKTMLITVLLFSPAFVALFVVYYQYVSAPELDFFHQPACLKF